MGFKARAVDRAERVEIASRDDWRAWLAANHRQTDGIWLVFHKKHHRLHVPWEHIVREALCFGWIDGLRRALDGDRTMIYVSPRRTGSAWSGINKRHVAELERAGLLHPAGRAKIDAAKRDGSWTLVDDIEALVVPADLARALDGRAGARNGYEALATGMKRGLLWWIKSAKTEATRAARIDKTAREAARGRSPIG